MYYVPKMTTEQSDPPTRAAGLVTVQLGAALKRDWTKWCVDRDLVPGKALRALVEKALAEGLELTASSTGAAVRVAVAKHLDPGPKVSRELQFTPSENAAIDAVASSQGFAFQEWVIRAARAALAKAPAYGQAELEALTQSNAHLAQLVVELAAVRRQESSEGMATALGSLESDIRQHVETVSAAMAQGAQRWQLKL